MGRRRQVRDYMTLAPHSIGLDQSLSFAAKRMRELHIRHLPVLHGGVLYGVLSERDVALVRGLELDPDEVTVEEVVIPEPLTVSADTPLARAARSMAEHKYGCAVVMSGPHLQGIFTTTDALNALADVLEEETVDPQLLPSQVRNIILSEHVSIRALLDRCDQHAQRILAGGGFSEADVLSLRGIAYQLATGITRHMELENRVLAPALASLDAFGSAGAQRLLEEHAEQKTSIERVLTQFDDPSQAPAVLAAALAQLITTLRRDMDLEEQTLLHPELLRDDAVVSEE